jgi:spermidine/putrescine ABC transporter ATP-binding subunit
MKMAQAIAENTRVLIKNVTRKFGETTAVDSANIDISSGEFMTLLGPSGCGKTTLLSMILGILDVSDGEIYFNNTRIDYIPMHKRDVGMVFQNYALFPHMTVEKNVEFGLEMRKVPKEERKKRVAEALELVQLEHLAHRFPKELSGGQQQRVALARAIVVRPKVLLLDEPLSNLDAKLRKDMRIQLKKLHQDLGITTIYVTHDQEEALSLSTKVAVMSFGVVQQIGTPKEIFLHPKNHFVANFIGYTNFFKGKFVSRDRDYLVFESEQKYKLKVEDDGIHQIGDEVLLTIKPENIKIMEDQAEFNSMKGKVIVSDYVGNTTGYEIETEFKEKVKVNVLGLESYPAGHEINLFLDPKNLLIINQE